MSFAIRIFKLFTRPAFNVEHHSQKQRTALGDRCGYTVLTLLPGAWRATRRAAILWMGESGLAPLL
jgi:hypothetical protein